MSKESRELAGDWLIVVGAVGLFVSLFLTWSHQFSPAFLAEWGASAQLSGVPHDPTAWQVYSVADVLLALVALALVVAALLGGRRVRAAVGAAAAVAVAFTLHALARPPSAGANIFDPSLSVPNYFPNSPAAGVGETLALLGLGLALGGLLLSFSSE
jgi:hypothetical protein